MMNVNISCLGNHELDVGIEKCKELIAQTNCPWIITNLLEKATGKPFLGLDPFKVQEHQGFKIGFLGFAEKEWLECLNSEIDLATLEFEDFNSSLKKYSAILKSEPHNCDFIIAINHMRVPNDQDMAAKNTTDVVDLIFGGHDHTYFVELNQETGVHICKSATDFECFTNLTLYMDVSKADFEAFKRQLEQELEG